jgi:hypothetical protein
VEDVLQALETATKDNYRKPRIYLDDKRFYLTEEQCRRANAALERIRKLPREPYSIFINTAPFEHDPEMNDGYFF